MKHIILTMLLLVSTSLFAQIGPNPLSNLSSWRVEEVYSLGQTVIRGGVIYQSLENGNVAFDPAGSPGQWTTIIGSAGGSNPGSPNQAVQFNNSSAFGGDASFTYNTATKLVTMASQTVGNGQVITPAVTSAMKSGSADAYTAIQTALTAAETNCAEVYIPAGNYTSSAGLTYAANCARVRGGGGQVTLITASGSGYNTLTVGEGTGTQNVPSGYVRDIWLAGPGKPGSPTGQTCLVVNGLLKFVVDSVLTQNCDIGLNPINNNYGLVVYNYTANGGLDNVSINLGTGSVSGSDLTFVSNWLSGAVASVSMTSGAGGYHFYGGQMSILAPSPCDTCGVLIMGKDYLTGSTTDLGTTGADLHAVSFENPSNGWAVRAFNETVLLLDRDPLFNYSATTLGLYKNTHVGNGTQLDFRDIFVQGTFTNSDSGCPLISTPNGWGLVDSAIESNTTTDNSSLTMCGTPTTISSMAAQSGLLRNIRVINDLNGRDSFPGSANGLMLANDGNGNLETSSNGGSTFVLPLTLPPSSAAYDLPYTNSADTGLARLPGNTSAVDGVVVSHGAGTNTPSPSASTCAANTVGGISPSPCTISVSFTAGQSVVCGLANSEPSGTTFTGVTDSHGDVFTLLGSLHSASTISQQTQFAVFGPLTTSITSVSVSVITPNYPTIQCNAATNLVSPAQIDGAIVFADTTSSTTINATPISISGNNDLVFCDAHNTTGGDNFTAGSGFTTGSTVNGNNLAQYKVQSTIGSFTPSITSSGANPATMACIALKATGTAAAPYITNSPQLSLPLYTVSSGTGYPALPSASSVALGTQVGITDCTSYTPGALCTGGGSDFMVGISNGAAWTVH